jgi:hypothetical protein
MAVLRRIKFSVTEVRGLWQPHFQCSRRITNVQSTTTNERRREVRNCLPNFLSKTWDL